MKLYLVRHAQSETNIGNNTGKDPILSKTEIEQAKRLGMYFQKKIQKDIKIYSANDKSKFDTQGKSAKARSGKPAIYPE